VNTEFLVGRLEDPVGKGREPPLAVDRVDLHFQPHGEARAVELAGLDTGA